MFQIKYLNGEFLVNSFVMNNLSSPVADVSNKLSGIDEELQSDVSYENNIKFKKSVVLRN